MAKFNIFSSENFLISLGGHLVLVAIMLSASVFVINRAKMVVPDRIQIMEIDLSDVVVSGEETKLYNVGNQEKSMPEAEEIVPVDKSEQEAKTADTEPEEIEQPTLADEPKPESKEEVEKKEEEKKEDSKPVAPIPEPKKRKVVRVNREVLSLDRTLTVSVVDALRVAMTRCWVVDSARPDIADIRAVAHLAMRKNGTVRDVWFESQARADTDAAFAYVLQTIRDAINRCQPFRMLPENEFLKWEKIQLTFYPTQGKVM